MQQVTLKLIMNINYRRFCSLNCIGLFLKVIEKKNTDKKAIKDMKP